MSCFLRCFIRSALITTLLPLFISNIAQAASDDNQAVVLQYHHISSTTPRSTSVTADEFRQHMEFLRDNGFAILPLQDVVQALREGRQLPDKAAAITFDDSNASVYTTAFPLLKEYGWPFTVFVPTGLVGSNSRLYTDWDQLREMAKAGATLANHSVSHDYLLQRKNGESEAEWLKRMEREIVDAEQKILDETGQSHKIYAYPFGEYDPQTEALVTKLGYVAFAQHSGPINAASNFTALPRFPFSGVYAPVRTFAPKVLSLAFNVSISEPVSPVTSDTSPSAVLDFNGSYRLDALTCYVADNAMEVALVDAGQQQFRVTSTTENRGRRFRYNCTAPGREGRFYWFSVPWFNPAIPDG
ncbi:MAG: polysaccharide deacetylase family protein [Pseudomonadota bacterium]